MMKKYAASIALTTLLMAAGHAQAAFVVDTGTPTGGVINALVLDSANSFAGLVNFSQASTINSINSYLLDNSGGYGGNYQVSLYSNNAGKVGGLLDSATETYTADGWNSASALNWAVNSGNYWVAIEGATDGSSNFVAPVGTPSSLLSTAFNDGTTHLNSGYKVYNGLNFGLQVDATAVAAVPEPGEYMLMLLGLGMMGFMAVRRNNNV